MELDWLSVGVGLVNRATGQVLEKNPSFNSMVLSPLVNENKEEELANDVLKVLGIKESDFKGLPTGVHVAKAKQVQLPTGRWLEVRLKLVGDDRVLLEVTNLNLAHKLVDEEQLFGQSKDGFWDWHIKENYKYLSPRTWEIFGYSSPQEMKPSELHKMLFQEDYPALLECFQKHVATRSAHPFQAECRYKHKNGSTVHFLCKGRVVEWDKTDGAWLERTLTLRNCKKAKQLCSKRW